MTSSGNAEEARSHSQTGRSLDQNETQSPHSNALGASGHSSWRRARFAHALVAPFVVMSAVTFGKDLYILEFGADPQVLGFLMLICSFVSPVIDAIMGTLQDLGRFLTKWFPLASWGRRAPWYRVHSIGCSVVLFAFFLPPSYDSAPLLAWFAALWVFAYWCVSACLNAFQIARVEVYSLTEERIILELYCKFTNLVGIACGFSAAFLCISFPSRSMFVAASSVCFLVVLSGNVTTDVMREGRNAPPKRRDAVLHNLVYLVQTGPALHMCLLSLLQGMYDMIIFSLQLSVLTFVYKKNKEVRLFWFALGGISMMVAEVVCAPIWSRLFAKSQKMMLYVPITLRVVDAVLAPIILLTWKTPLALTVYLFSWRVCNSGYMFWRVAASGWVCDYEDVGEGMLIGLFTMGTQMGKSLGISLCAMGLGWAGLVASNCLQEEGPAREACDLAKITGQPDSVQTYLEVMYAVVAPSLSLTICLLTYLFPIAPGSAILEELQVRRTGATPAKLPHATTDEKVPPDLDSKEETYDLAL